MKVITAYLDAMFSAYPQTQRMLEAKTELHGMMEDAYTSLLAEGHSENEAVGRVIRDFGDIEEVAPGLGITSEVAPASAAAPPPDPNQGSSPVSAPHPPVTLDEARSYAEAQQRIRIRLSAALVLFVLSPVTLLVLPTLAESDLVPLTKSAGLLAGVLVLLGLVAVGLVLFVSAARAGASPRRIAEGRFSEDPRVTHWAKKLADRHEPARIRALKITLVLSILAPIPLIGFALFLEDSAHHHLWIVIGVGIVLGTVATALGFLVPRAWAHTVADTLTRGAHGRAVAGRAAHQAR